MGNDGSTFTPERKLTKLGKWLWSGAEATALAELWLQPQEQVSARRSDFITSAAQRAASGLLLSKPSRRNRFNSSAEVEVPITYGSMGHLNKDQNCKSHTVASSMLQRQDASSASSKACTARDAFEVDTPPRQNQAELLGVMLYVCPQGAPDFEAPSLENAGSRQTCTQGTSRTEQVARCSRCRSRSFFLHLRTLFATLLVKGSIALGH